MTIVRMDKFPLQCMRFSHGGVGEGGEGGEEKKGGVGGPAK